MNEAQPKRLLPIIIGMAATAALLGLLAYFAQLRRSEEAAIPQLNIIWPAPHAVVDSPLRVRFTTPAKLENGASGWNYQGMHLHGWVDTTPLMPAAADIRILAPDTFEWTMFGAPHGTTTVRLGWADATHKPLSAGASDNVPVTIR